MKFSERQASMNRTIRSLASAVTGALAVVVGSVAGSAQASTRKTATHMVARSWFGGSMTPECPSIVDETWGLWSLPSYVCSGDSGGGIFLNAPSGRTGERLVSKISDGGRDCRRHNNNNRLDTRAIQMWIDATVKANWEK
jgi:hypothetical protein